MVFKRRDRRPIWQVVLDFVWPRGGWVRAFEYVKHRVRRLPDTPEKISRGIWAGVFTAFTPFFGLHFVIAWLIARLMRGNILAALLGTFFGNPLTYVPIAATSLWFGHRLVGGRPPSELETSLSSKFTGAWNDLFHNFRAIFTPETMDWHRLSLFYDDVFFPFMIGGIIPGIIAATFAYYLSVPVIRVYQNSRRKRLQAKLGQLRKKPENAS
ncbi:DUF2062 domain-containing protein [Flavimaricola marinus]|uniref:DUF2062 domain-containing protein n=1 Tax=Flavimaricola marinus TaxID=1819565 RepID=A0A238LAN0_9RHOB|nr:DUF2062 domain-containing protein [Flavimaricola marinus]SMY06474.1 hypothetical protein LOM8899_00599 [Flavimaricola marinus]